MADVIGCHTVTFCPSPLAASIALMASQSDREGMKVGGLTSCLLCFKENTSLCTKAGLKPLKLHLIKS